MKTLYKLRPCKTLQTDFYVFDVETNGLRAKSDAFIFGVIYSHNFTKVLYSVDEFKMEFRKPRYHKKKVFAHNASYDLDTIYDCIYNIDENAIFNGKFIGASNGNCYFADSMNIFPTSVAKLGELTGKKKQKLSNEFLTGKNVEGNIKAKDINYCIRDCEIVYDALVKAFEQAGQICITQASLSMAYFRRYHLPFNIVSNNSNEYFFNSYYGGRTEAFKIGETHAYAYDANSMYPFSMITTNFPNPRSLRHIKNVTRQTFKKILYGYEGCAQLEIEHKDIWIGYLPKKMNGKLIFPTGNFSGWWNFNEIRYAYEAGVIKIKKVLEVVYSEPMNTIFKSFINTLYNNRFSTNDPFEIYRIKIFMNSLYGKFAQRIKEETTYIDNINDLENIYKIEAAKKDGKFIKLQMFNMDRSDAYLITKKDKFKEAKHSIPSFASYITSHSRVVLLDKIIKSKNYNPVYCDTDSVFTEMELPEEKSIDGNNKPILGAWKKEDKIVTKIRGLKNYDCDTKGEFERHIKGVPQKRTPVNDLNVISENEYEYKSLIKTKEALKRGIESGVLTQRTKKLSGEYNKRIVHSDGWTEPIKL